MRSKLALAGHPLHPMLVPIPIGLFVWAFVADLVYLATDRDQLWYDIAFWTGIAAWITALVAALPGIGDLLTVAAKTNARQIALAHMALNVTIVGLYFVAMLLMLDDGAVSGTNLAIVIVLHALGSGLLLVSGWLGGEMSYRHHIGMVPDNAELEQAESLQHRRT
jgi:uncharacterized membrane protein